MKLKGTPVTQMSPSRRTVLRTAAWSVPAVSIAAAAPAFAASPPLETPPNLAGTVVTTPARSGSTISFAPFDIVNSGGVDTAGVNLTFQLGTGEITEVLGQYGAIPVQIPVDGFGGSNGNEISVSNRPADVVTLFFPEDFWDSAGNAHANNGTPLNTTVTLFLQTTHDGPNTVDVTITAGNADSGTPAGASFTVA